MLLDLISAEFFRCLWLSDSSRFGENVIRFDADISSSVHIDNKKKDIFILGEGLMKGLDDTALIIEK